ncbi:MAG: restriction endonuclease [Bacteroidota bacterium]
MSNPPFSIRKATGEQEAFIEEKLRESLARAGADETTIEQIIREVEDHLFEGIPTKNIYRTAFNLLKRRSRASAARYKLKRAIMELGPSGYPFERYIGELMKCMGYVVEVGVVLPGQCITHEVDVYAENPDTGLRIAVECKFGNRADKKIDVRVPLYINSRFEDLKYVWLQDEERVGKAHQGWIVTNTAFTEDAKNYGKCAGLRMLSWEYPENNSLKDLIDRHSLYPVTSLTVLTKAEKKRILDRGIVLSCSLANNEALLRDIRVPNSRLKRAMAEIDELCEA